MLSRRQPNRIQKQSNDVVAHNSCLVLRRAFNSLLLCAQISKLKNPCFSRHSTSNRRASEPLSSKSRVKATPTFLRP